MSGELIHPNWHLVIMHFPLGLLISGIIIELLSFAWRKSGFRAAGRWMILLGALMTIPTILAGIYAFRDVVVPGTSNDPGLIPWYEVQAQNQWPPEAWHMISDHIIFNSIAGVIFLLIAVLWLATSDRTRVRLFWPLIAGGVVGLILLVIGAWHGGELVYRSGAGVENAPGEPAGLLQFLAPPLQLHMVLIGFAVAFAVGALATTIRSWERPAQIRKAPPTLMAEPLPLVEDPARDRESREILSAGPMGAEEVTVKTPPRLRPALFWLIGGIIALAGAGAGLWSVVNVFDPVAFQANWYELRGATHHRLLLHVIFGVSAAVLLLLLSGFVRFWRRNRMLTIILMVLLGVAILLQLWFGILMLYDGHTGPITGFTPSSMTI